MYNSSTQTALRIVIIIVGMLVNAYTNSLLQVRRDNYYFLHTDAGFIQKLFISMINANPNFSGLLVLQARSSQKVKEGLVKFPSLSCV